MIVSFLNFVAKVLPSFLFEFCDQCFASAVIVSIINIADGKDSFPLVMVGGVLEGNKGWGIAQEVVNCISKDYPGVVPIWPKVSMCFYLMITMVLFGSCCEKYSMKNMFSYCS